VRRPERARWSAETRKGRKIAPNNGNISVRPFPSTAVLLDAVREIGGLASK
jgi:hypothetical protein